MTSLKRGARGGAFIKWGVFLTIYGLSKIAESEKRHRRKSGQFLEIRYRALPADDGPHFKSWIL